MSLLTPTFRLSGVMSQYLYFPEYDAEVLPLEFCRKLNELNNN
jgi:hypothetical protein